jgi:hypothetical protein
MKDLWDLFHWLVNNAKFATPAERDEMHEHVDRIKGDTATGTGDDGGQADAATGTGVLAGLSQTAPAGAAPDDAGAGTAGA